MVWRPMSAELRFLKRAVAEHVRREEEERISWLHSLVSISSFLITALIEFIYFFFPMFSKDLLYDCSGAELSFCSSGLIP